MKDQLDKLEQRISIVEGKVVRLEKEDIKTEIHLKQVLDSVSTLVNKIDVIVDRMNQVEKETSKNSDNRMWNQDIFKHVVKWAVITFITYTFITTIGKL